MRGVFKAEADRYAPSPGALGKRCDASGVPEVTVGVPELACAAH